MEKVNENVLSKAFESGKQHEMKSGGCPQCTIACIFEALDTKNDEVFRATTRLAELVGEVAKMTAQNHLEEKESLREGEGRA